MSSNTISTASNIIGFISFGTSLGTLVRVLWDELTTLFDAPTQVHFALSNLKEALYEEQDAVKRLVRIQRRRNRRRGSAGSGRDGYEKGATRLADGTDAGGMDIRIMQQSIHMLCQRFTKIEKPFLQQGQVDPRRGRSDGWDDAETATRYTDEGFEHDYCDMTLGLRFRWLRTKGEVNTLWTLLNRFQLRRIAREVTVNLLYVPRPWREIMKSIPLMPGREGRALDRNLRDLKLIPDHDSDDPDLDGQHRVHVRRKRSRRSEGEKGGFGRS
jgi:hypothetical protein